MHDSLGHVYEENSLQHFGVKGMKWGKRKANPNYSSNQQKRDTQIYGRGGSRRINNNLNKGDSISVARGTEKIRRDRVIGKNKYVRQGGKVVGAVGAIGAVNIGISQLKGLSQSFQGQRAVRSVFGMRGVYAVKTIAELADTPIARVAISTGAAKVGTMFAGDAAVSANMRLHGYDPNRR